MIEATLDMLRVRRDERVAIVGVLCGVVSDDLDDLPRRLEAVRDSAREIERATARKDRHKRATYRRVADVADDLIAPARQMADRMEGFTDAV